MAESGGTVGGRYSLVERVGSGAMGVVWRARDGLLDREVAVKQLRWPDLTADEVDVARARAMREARNAARLQHPDAISVFDVVVEDDRPWLVMEYLPSRSLAGLLAEEGGLEPAEAARIGRRVATALAAAHAAGIVHRDVKPSNVLIGHDGAVKLTDFGISRAAGDGTLTDSGMITGTPAYLAPEVARGEQPGRASDVFSLGATLYAAVEGRSPHGVSDNNFGLLYRAAAGRIEPPTRSGALTGVLTRLLAADPAERPTAAEAAQLLAGPVEAEAAAVRAATVRTSAVRAGTARAGAGRTAADRAGVSKAGAGRTGADRTGAGKTEAGRTGAARAEGVKAAAVEAGAGRAGAVEAGAVEPGAGTAAEDPGSAAGRRWPAPVVATVVLLVVTSAVVLGALRPDFFGGDSAGGLQGGSGPTAPAYTTEDAAELIRSHYDLLPESTEAAWDNLAAGYRQPFPEYQAFWGQYDEVRTDLFEAVQDGASTRFVVRVRVTFIQAGVETAGRYQLLVEPSDGRLRITWSELLI
ncbi:serine/threonine-protein kinase [Saccharothrix sp. HUAS TT1]|uniref:serine/threonine-protein kinase n=1 Tax=unclassified Saccharothrix TaxID=2593673 RepID=UPI00345BB6E3